MALAICRGFCFLVIDVRNSVFTKEFLITRHSSPVIRHLPIKSACLFLHALISNLSPKLPSIILFKKKQSLPLAGIKTRKQL